MLADADGVGRGVAVLPLEACEPTVCSRFAKPKKTIFEGLAE